MNTCTTRTAAALLAATLLTTHASTALACTAYGAIYSKWSQLSSTLGSCVNDEHDDGHGGRIQQFQGGFIDWTPARGAYAVYGLIGQTYSAFGLANFGHPITDELETRDGHGRFNDFASDDNPWQFFGSIYWNASCTPSAWNGYCAARTVYGSIWDHWNWLNRELGPMGYPEKDAEPCSVAWPYDNACYQAPAGAVVQHFAGNASNGYHGATILWSPSGTTVHEFSGCCLFADGVFAGANTCPAGWCSDRP